MIGANAASACGGGIAITNALNEGAQIVNNTVVGNSGSGICWGNAGPAVVNNIVAANTWGLEQDVANPLSATIRNNDVFGNTLHGKNTDYFQLADRTGIDGNLSVDPLLVRFGAHRQRIQADSPCRDAGDDTVVGEGRADIDAEARIQGAHADIGADESDGSTWTDVPAGVDGRGLQATKAVTLRPDDPLVDLEVSLRREGREIPVRVTWGPGFEANDAPGSATIHYTGQAVLLRGAKPERFARSGFDEEIRIGETAGLRWVGLEEQYFTALFVPAGSKASVALRPASARPMAAAGTQEEPKPENQILVAVGLPEGKARIYVGAKKYSVLHGLGLGLEKVVWFSNYDLIGWFAKYLFLAVLWIHNAVVSNYGFAIILATIGLRLALFPLNQSLHAQDAPHRGACPC